MRKTLLASMGGVGAALLGSLCCAGPLLFVFFGVGAGLASTFEPLRPLFTVLTVAALGFGFYITYGRGRGSSLSAESCGPEAVCAAPRSRTRDRLLLWSATVMAVLLWSFPYWAILLV